MSHAWWTNQNSNNVKNDGFDCGSSNGYLSTVRVAFAASTEASISPGYNEMLRLAQEKVQAATQPGAFGNGVPLLTDIMSMLPWIGIAISAAIGALIAARILIPKMQREALIAQ